MTIIDLSAAGTGSPNRRGYLSEPEGTGPFPAVLMIHEAFGLNDISLRQADRLGPEPRPNSKPPWTRWGSRTISRNSKAPAMPL